MYYFFVETFRLIRQAWTLKQFHILLLTASHAHFSPHPSYSVYITLYIPHTNPSLFYFLPAQPFFNDFVTQLSKNWLRCNLLAHSIKFFGVTLLILCAHLNKFPLASTCMRSSTGSRCHMCSLRYFGTLRSTCSYLMLQLVYIFFCTHKLLNNTNVW